MQITIIHNTILTDEDNTRRIEIDHDGMCLGAFFDFCRKCITRVAYTYDRPETATVEQVLETVYRENNAVDGSEENVKRQKRSLSVGDVVIVNGRSAHKVASMGFEEVDLTDVFESLGNPLPEGAVAR